MKANVEKINFPTIADFTLGDNKEFIMGDIDFINTTTRYSLFSFYESGNVLVLLPVTNNGEINQGYSVAYMSILSDIKSILYDIVPYYQFKDNVVVRDATFLDFSAQVHDKLSSYIIRTVDMLRWRLNLGGVHDYLQPEDYQFSLDGKVWFRMPFKKDVTIRVNGASLINYEIVNQAQNLMRIYNREPLEHEIYREAYNNRDNNPRSALIMAVASAEIGFKRLASELHPQNKWLLGNIQSPPLHKMLKNYLPLLPSRLGDNNKVILHKTIIRTIQEAIEERNKLVHTGISKIDENKLLEILDLINDLLYLFDYCRGLKWALGNISPKTYNNLKFE